ncbi:hypothetical protein FQA39_LY17212 [Lamprigera yunnana]|nr:hypothetical protein FQA39_LY17212 [Lamprigera yunnana]
MSSCRLKRLELQYEITCREFDVPESMTVEELRKSVRNVWKLELDESFPSVAYSMPFVDDEAALSEYIWELGGIVDRFSGNASVGCFERASFLWTHPILLSPQNLPNSPKGVQMKRNHVPCDIFEELLQRTCLEPYSLVSYKSSINLADPFVDEMEITCTCDKTGLSMNVCLEHYTNGPARDHQISVDNKPTNLDDLFVDEIEIVYRPAPEQQITVEIPDTPPPPIFDSRDPMSVTIAEFPN